MHPRLVAWQLCYSVLPHLVHAVPIFFSIVSMPPDTELHQPGTQRKTSHQLVHRRSVPVPVEIQRLRLFWVSLVARGTSTNNATEQSASRGSWYADPPSSHSANVCRLVKRGSQGNGRCQNTSVVVSSSDTSTMDRGCVSFAKVAFAFEY